MGAGTFDTLNPYTLKGTSPSATGNFVQYGISEAERAADGRGTGCYDPSGDEPILQRLRAGCRLGGVQPRTCSWVVFNLRQAGPLP